MLSWQDKFRKERSEKNDLLQKVTTLEQALSLSRDQCRQRQLQLESGLNHPPSQSHTPSSYIESRHDGNGNGNAALLLQQRMSKSFRKEEEDFIQDLRARNEALQQEQKRLQGRLKGAVIMIKKLKSQIATLKLRSSNGLSGGHGHGGGGRTTKTTRSMSMFSTPTTPMRPRSARSQVHRSRSDGDVMRGYDGSKDGGGGGVHGTSAMMMMRMNHSSSSDGCRISVGHDATADEDQIHATTTDADTGHVLSSLQQRLLRADQEIKQLKEENKRLLVDHHNLQSSKSNVSSFALGHDYTNISSSTSAEIATELSQSNVHELQSRLKVMEVQYNTLQSTSQVQLQVHQQTRTKLEDCNAYIRKLRNELQQVRREKEELDRNNAVEVTEQHEEQMKELMEENKMLEERLANLCDLPFVAQHHRRNSNGGLMTSSSLSSSPSPSIIDEEVEDEEQRQQYKNLVAQIKELESEIDHHKRQVEVLSKDNLNYERSASALREENDDLKEQCLKLESNMGRLRDELDEYEQRCTNTNIERVSAYSQTDVLWNEGGTFEDGKIGPTATANHTGVVDTSCQTEFSVRVPELMGNMGRGSVNNVPDDGNRKNAIDQLNEKVNALQQVSTDRLERIRSLEERLDNIGSGVVTRISEKKNDHDVGDRLPLPDGFQSVDDQNSIRFMMVKILNCELISRSVTATTNTFLVVDLLDYEMRGSAISSGNNPDYKFEATYEVKIDRFMLQQLEKRGISFEVYKVEGESMFELYGHCSLKLGAIFESGLNIDESTHRQRIQIMTSNSSSAQSKQVGFINVCVNLASSVERLRNATKIQV